MMKTYITGFLLFSIFFAFSQQRVALKGRLFLDEYEESNSGIYITNETTNITTISDFFGGYSITAQIGDILTFKAYNINTRKITITETMYNKQYLSVQLNVKQKYLDEVTVVPFKSYGSLELDVKRIPYTDPTTKLLKNIDMLTVGQAWDGKTNHKTLPIGFSMNVDDMFDIISGNQKKREKLYAYEKQMSDISNIRKYFGDDYFTKELNFAPNEIDEFIFYLYWNENIKFYYETGNWFQIIDTFSKKYISYKARRLPKNSTKNTDQDSENTPKETTP